jgi:hypothetical protein
MVYPSIITAALEIATAWKSIDFSYDSDYHPKWVVENIEETVEKEILLLNINISLIPSYLEEQLREAIAEICISANIQAEIDALDMEETYRSLMPGRI